MFNFVGIFWYNCIKQHVYFLKMIKFKKEKVTTLVDKIDVVICNCCGKKITTDHYCGSDITPISVEFGYGSRFDMEIWKMDICDSCIGKWVRKFKHKVEKNNTEF